MLTNYLAGALLLAPVLALAQAPATYPYLIKGKLGQYNAPAKVYLISGVQPIDSTTLEQGQFVLKGTTPFPSTATLVLERQGRLQSGWREMMFGGKMQRAYIESPDRLRVFLEPGPVVVTSSDSVLSARVVGGPLTADYQRLGEALKPVLAKRPSTMTQELFDAFGKAYAQAQLAFVKANPTSWVSLEVLGQARQMGPPQYAEVAPLYAALTPAQRASPPGQQYGELLLGLKATAVGRPAPAFTQRTPSARPAASRCRWPTTGASTCWSISGPAGVGPAAPRTPLF